MATRPTAAKAPQDHQPKTEKPKVEKITITITEDGDERTIPGRRVTLRGIDVEVADEALDDFEVLDDIRAVQDANDASRLPSLLRRLVGEQYRSVLDQLRGPNGRVTTSDGAQFVLDLFQALNPN
ncbi:hypothetical protein [Microbacterium kunmingense]|uniref:hypothetical protein n=1 Tax=Microbacterium kunmingense TaxID=2915939 RepID=UPI0020052679|nr:hypothetical protein [Microbacterium kunmingense]